MAQKKFNTTALDPNKVQRQASDPKASVWLSANAGTGKTKVLTDRVLRLLLDGSAPEDILCVTFTTAASALMQRRIRNELSKWTTCTDYILDKELKKLTGKKPDVRMRNHARQLFARFLEAPEGIKIQTIHSLSQTLIKKFPIESGVPPSFKVMGSEDTLALIHDAQAEILNAVQDKPNSDLARAVRMITPEVGEAEFVSLIKNIVTNREYFYQTIEKHGSLDDAIEAVYDYLGADRDITGGDHRFMMGHEEGSFTGEPPNLDALRDAVDILSQGSKTDQEKAELLRVWLNASIEERDLMFREYTRIFLTDKLEIRKTLVTKKSAAAEDAMYAEAERLLDVLEEIKTANVARGTEALMVLGDAVLDAYEQRKRAHNYLDYDDLILKATKLLAEDDNASWALAKLPGHLKHILVDEAQDTSPHQWKIVENLMTAFLKDPMRTGKDDRTLFVVGDEKQSIFSFQGADPIEFASRKAFFKKLIKESGGTWRDVNMDITFRSSPAILDAVDAVFKSEAAGRGVKFDETQKVSHKSFRQGHAGLVEINPIVKGQKPEDIEPWSLPDQMEEFEDASIDLAETIADRIHGWLEKGEELESRGRPINPNDIMILVRRRSSFVDHVVRALKKRNVPVSGVDRMVLSEQIAVKDLLVLGEALLNPNDDYKLAVALKTPILGLSDKQLEDIAIGRKGSLWEALEHKSKSRAKRNQIYKDVFAYLTDLKEQLSVDGTYKFYSNVLLRPCPASEKSGLAAVYKRLGFEAEDPMVEFMNALERFERDNPPSLQSFLRWVVAGDAEVKREMSHSIENPKVSIMTVHGAKGLEAPIVILPDTTGIPADNIQARPRLLWPLGKRDVPLWVPNTSLENSQFKAERAKVEAARDDEYRRLMYVAMTRAADRLYVYGHQNGQNVRSLSWHSLISTGLMENLSDKLSIEQKDDEQLEITYKTEQQAKPEDDGVKPYSLPTMMALPEWTRTSPEQEDEEAGKFIPSKALEDFKQQAAGNDNKRALPSPLKQGTDDSYRFKYGNITHNLLEFVPHLPAHHREKAAQDYLKDPTLGLTEKQRNDIWNQIKTVLEHPEYAFIFGDNARAEVNITGTVVVNGEKKNLNGQIDRLVVEDETVWIVDYKSNAKIPETDAQTPDIYVAQMAAYKHIIQQIYPDKAVKTVLLWTRAPKLQVLKNEQLNEISRKMGLNTFNDERVIKLPRPGTQKSNKR